MSKPKPRTYSVKSGPPDDELRLHEVVGPTPCRLLAWEDDHASTAQNVADELNAAMATRDRAVAALKSLHHEVRFHFGPTTYLDGGPCPALYADCDPVVLAMEEAKAALKELGIETEAT